MQKKEVISVMNLNQKNKQHFECSEIEKYVQQYVDNMLDDEKRRLFEEHIEYCLPCDKKVEFEKKFKEIVRLKVKKEVPPEVVHKKLKSILKDL